jgi:DNA-binding response OmpR family regulator
MSKRMLIIGPDAGLNEEGALYLTRAGYIVRTATSRWEGLRQLHLELPDLIVIDVGHSTAGADGWQLCQDLRAVSDKPLVLVVARPEEIEQAQALDVNHCLIRPIQAEEWTAGVKKALSVHAEKAKTDKAITVSINGELRLDFSVRRLEVRGQIIDLTRKEFELLACFVKNLDRFVPYDELLETMWDDKKANRTALKAYIWRLRQKIERDPQKPEYILTRRGVGYLFKSSS